MGKRKPLLALLASSALSLSLLSAPVAAAQPEQQAVQGGNSGNARQLTDVIPMPVEVHPDRDDDFRLTPWTVIRVDQDRKEAKQVAKYLAELLRPATGYTLPVVPHDWGWMPGITLQLGSGDIPRIGDEGYKLNISSDGIVIKANTGDGLFYGVQTLRQLLPAEIESDSVVNRSWVVPGGRILDYPRYEYRSAQLDLARHFFKVGEIKKYIDMLAQYKINYLHLHLTDDQGWRIQIDSWPKLAPVGGGPGTGVGGVGGGWLTKAEYAEVIEYAQSRHITIVPEIDMPGHVRAAMSTYAKLNCDGTAPPPRTDMAVGYSSLCVDKPITYEFVEDVIREVAAMTPGPYIHIGGDEAHATSDAEYEKFMSKVIPIVQKYGKRVIGWHQIMQVEPPKSVIGQYWGTGNKAPAVARAAQRGNKIIMSPADKAYMDMKYNENTELGLSWAGYTTLYDAYHWDPTTVVKGVPDKAIFGVEAAMFSETLRTVSDIEFMAYPRLPAIAEIGWSAKSSHSWESFSSRIAEQAPRWELQGINFKRSPRIDWE